MMNAIIDVCVNVMDKVLWQKPLAAIAHLKLL